MHCFACNLVLSKEAQILQTWTASQQFKPQSRGKGHRQNHCSCRDRDTAIRAGLPELAAVQKAKGSGGTPTFPHWTVCKDCVARPKEGVKTTGKISGGDSVLFLSGYAPLSYPTQGGQEGHMVPLRTPDPCPLWHQAAAKGPLLPMAGILSCGHRLGYTACPGLPCQVALWASASAWLFTPTARVLRRGAWADRRCAAGSALTRPCCAGRSGGSEGTARSGTEKGRAPGSLSPQSTPSLVIGSLRRDVPDGGCIIPWNIWTIRF